MVSARRSGERTSEDVDGPVLERDDGTLGGLALAPPEAGATALIQPGGSMRDADVIAAADAAGLAMVFTGQRHFRH